MRLLPGEPNDQKPPPPGEQPASGRGRGGGAIGTGWLREKNQPPPCLGPFAGGAVSRYYR